MAEPERQDPNEDDRKKAAALLLLLEFRARRRLRSGIDTIVRIHSRGVRTLGDGFAASYAAANDIGPFVANEVTAIRLAAADAGMTASERELERVRKALQTMGQTPYRGPIASSVKRSTYDSSAVSETFLGKARERLSAMANEARGFGKALTHAGQTIRSRIDTIAATESSQAFSEARRRFFEEFSAGLERQGLRDAVALRWVAELDERTCKVCAGLDGLESDARGEFDGGYEPGSVHPRCRCYAVPVYSTRFGQRAA